MSALIEGLATNPRDAYRVCDVKPLEGDLIDRYYVPFESRQDAIIGVNSLLQTQEAGETSCILFTGHVGCGKSSELARIARLWQNDYEVIYIRASEETDVNDAQYVDLYLIIIKQVETALRQRGIRLDGDLLKSTGDWFLEITEEKAETVERSVNVEAEASLGSEAPLLAKFLFKVMAQIKGGSSQKRTIRETLKQEFSRLKTDTNLILSDGEKKLRQKFPDKKGILLILDDLDKCPPDVARHLFFDYASQMQELQCTVVYTVPIARLYDPRGISGIFNNPHIVPMINVYEFDRDKLDLDYNPDGLEAMAAMVARRVEVTAVFESRELVLDLARASGGHLRHMMQMMRDSCNHAVGMGHSKLKAENIAYGIKQLQFRFERAIPRSFDGELAQVARLKELTDDQVGQELLFSTAVLEYNGSNRWVYPHPVVRQSERFKRAIRDSQPGG